MILNHSKTIRNVISLLCISITKSTKKSGPLQIFMKFGIDMDSTKKLSHTKIWPILLIFLQDMTPQSLLENITAAYTGLIKWP